MSPDKHFGSGTRAGARRGLQNRRAAWKTWGWWVRFPCASAIFCSVKDGARSQGFFGALGTYASLGRRAVMSRSGAYLVGGLGPGRRGRARSARAGPVGRGARPTANHFRIPNSNPRSTSSPWRSTCSPLWDFADTPAKRSASTARRSLHPTRSRTSASSRSACPR